MADIYDTLNSAVIPEAQVFSRGSVTSSGHSKVVRETNMHDSIRSLSVNSVITENTGNIFQIEIFVHQINIIKKPLLLTEETKCVAVNFYIKENVSFDLTKYVSLSADKVNLINYDKGLSCMFALSENQMKLAKKEFIFRIEISQILHQSNSSDKSILGSCDVNICNEFLYILNMRNDKKSLGEKYLQNIYDFYDDFENKIGTIDVFIKLIDKSSFILNDLDNVKNKSCSQHLIQNGEPKDSTNSNMILKPATSSDKLICCCNKGSRDYGENMKAYEEIEANVSGNAMKIKLMKEKNTKIKPDSNYKFGEDNVLREDAQVYQNMTNVQKDNNGKILLDFANGVSKISNNTSPFVTQVNNRTSNINEDNQEFAIVPKNAVDLQPSSNDVFILRVNKKSKMIEDNKASLEIELVTPKGINRIKPRMETRDTQYDDKDVVKDVVQVEEVPVPEIKTKNDKKKKDKKKKK